MLSPSGPISSSCSSSTVSRICCETSSTLDPDSRNNNSTIDGRSSVIATPNGLRRAISTVATSPSRIGVPPAPAPITTCSSCLAWSGVSSVRTSSRRLPRVTSPADTSTSSPRTRSATVGDPDVARRELARVEVDVDLGVAPADHANAGDPGIRSIRGRMSFSTQVRYCGDRLGPSGERIAMIDSGGPVLLAVATTG